MRIHPLCARVCSPAVRRDDVLPRCHEEDARSVLPRRRRGALPSSFFFFLSSYQFHLLLRVRSSFLHRTSFLQQGNHPDRFLVSTLSLGEEKIFLRVVMCSSFLFLPRSTLPRRSPISYRLFFVKVFREKPFPLVLSPNSSERLLFLISRTRRGGEIRSRLCAVCNNPSEMSFRSRGRTICFHRISIVFDSIVWRISRCYIS